MKFTIETESLRKALAAAGVAAAGRTTLPILECVLIAAKDGRITIQSTNLDLWAKETRPAEIEREGAAVIASKTLSSLMGRISALKTTVEASKKAAVVTGGEAEAIFETLPAEEFPPPVDLGSSVQRIECEANEFLTPLRMVAHAMSTDQLRYNLNGVCLRSVPNGTDIVATNSSVMALVRTELRTETLNVILPADAVRAAQRNIAPGSLSISIGAEAALLKTAETELCSRLIEGKFPNYTSIIPKNGYAAYSAPRKELHEAISTAALFLRPNEIAVSIAGKGKQLLVACQDRFRQKLIGTELSDQPDQSISFNHRLMRDTLAALQGDAVRIEHNTDQNTACIREDRFTGVVGLIDIVS